MLGVAVKAAKVLISTGWRLASHRLKANRGLEFGHMAGEGIAEPVRRRYMIDFGSFAELHAEGKTFGGRPGRSVQAMHPYPWPGHPGCADLAAGE